MTLITDLIGHDIVIESAAGNEYLVTAVHRRPNKDVVGYRDGNPVILGWADLPALRKFPFTVKEII